MRKNTFLACLCTCTSMHGVDVCFAGAWFKSWLMFTWSAAGLQIPDGNPCLVMYPDRGLRQRNSAVGRHNDICCGNWPAVHVQPSTTRQGLWSETDCPLGGGGGRGAGCLSVQSSQPLCITGTEARDLSTWATWAGVYVYVGAFGHAQVLVVYFVRSASMWRLP